MRAGPPPPKLQKRWASPQYGSRSCGPGTGMPDRTAWHTLPGWAGPQRHARTQGTFCCNRCPQCNKRRAGTVRAAMRQEGINIPHRTVHSILREDGSADRHPRKSRRRRWVRYERTYSNSMWHTDWKQIRGGMYDGRWFLCYEDDASRFVTGYGVFDNATADNALAVLERAIVDHGRPASIMTDHGSQFYANKKETAKRGESDFEKRLVRLGIRQILAGVGHPQTNGKLERLHGEIQRKLHHFEGSSYGTAVKADPDCHVGGPFHTGGARDPMERFIDWYNNSRAHMSLDWEDQETSAQAFVRKMAQRQKGNRYRDR